MSKFFYFFLKLVDTKQIREMWGLLGMGFCGFLVTLTVGNRHILGGQVPDSRVSRMLRVSARVRDLIVVGV